MWRVLDVQGSALPVAVEKNESVTHVTEREINALVANRQLMTAIKTVINQCRPLRRLHPASLKRKDT